MNISSALTNSASKNILDLDNKHIKSYASLNFLLSNMEKTGVDKVRHLICRTPSGRWTAVIVGFQQHLLNSGFAQVS